MKKTLACTALALVLGTFGSLAAAHNVWLMPSSTVLSKADWITVDAAVSNDLFFFNHRPLALENLTVVAPDGSALAPENAATGKLRSVFDLNLTQTGTYRIAVLNQGAFARWKEAGDGQVKRARGSVEDIASKIPAGATDVEVTESIGRIETFATVGKPSAIKATGKGLELLPRTSPADLVQGEKATFAMHVDGKPAAGMAVNITRGDTRYRDQLAEVTVKTDAKGEFSVTWPQAGMYWLEASTRDNKTSVPNAKERRLTYTATLEVLP
ncbi:DUF4198 domain-containing protein [Variovorax sp.]|uniref:DUF4198 domain-containing protein n=1 Tax=Variovorax sp. TaxID=1871043 RepID=UPI002D2BD793|nr:DUF4198 domain-containing protein [Variovorax sp.]HYP81733.1 DUF4198 domain-containing protein [Variovorax sp.]